MKIRIAALALIVPVLFVAGIGGAMAFNLWSTVSSKEPAAFASGEFAGVANPADLRGSYSLADIEKAYGVPVDALARAFGVTAGLAGDAGPAAYQVKNFEGLYEGLSDDLEIGTDSVRWFVALYAGLPYEPQEGTGLPNAAIPVLREKGVEAGALDRPRAAVVELPGVAQVPAAAEGATEGTGSGAEAAESRTIVGKTTFGMIEDWGVSREKMAEALGRDPGASNAVVRDWLAAQGLEFSEYKPKLQALVDAAR